MRAPVVLHTISSFDRSIQEKSATSTIRGIAFCIREPGALRNEMTNSPDFWAILKTLQSIEKAAPMVFKIVEDVTASNSSAITADNYEMAVSLLNDFASAGRVGSAAEQKQDAIVRKGRSPKVTKRP